MTALEQGVKDRGVRRHFEGEERANGMPARVDRTSIELVAGGSSVEALAGAGAVVLAILGLSGILPTSLAAIAAICVGAALLFEGASIAARWSDILDRTSEGRLEEVELGGGMSVEMLGGVGGVALGILALIGLAPMTLLAAAAITLGGAMALGAGADERLNDLVLSRVGAHDTTRKVARYAVQTASGAEVLVGLGGVTLGILALIGFTPQILVLVSMLALGAGSLLTGGALAGRMGQALHRR